MFTGLIEETGIVEKVRRGKLLRLEVSANTVVPDTKPGGSIAVNGVCLTVTGIDKKIVSFDVMAQTQEKTALGRLKSGDRVNLERALSAGARLAGHIVSGHVDTVGFIRGKTEKEGEAWLEINAGEEFMAYLVPRGSVAVDGVGLTVAGVEKDYFRVSLIPHTLKITNLGFKKRNDAVNLEADMIARYVFRFLERHKAGGSPRLSREFLKNFGFDE